MSNKITDLLDFYNGDKILSPVVVRDLADKFGFVVTNTSNASDILTNHGVLYNGNFYVDNGLRFVDDTVVPQSAIITNS